MPTTQRILQLSPIAQYLAANYVQKRGLYGGTRISEKQVQWIFALNKILQRIYAADSTYEMQKVANYLYELIQPFAFQAAFIYDGGGGGQVVPPTSNLGATPLPYDWEIGASTSSTAPMKDGDTTVTLDGTNGTRDFRGYNIEFTRNDYTQYTTPPSDGITTYYSWNRVTGVLVLLNSPSGAVLTERFRILPV